MLYHLMDNSNLLSHVPDRAYIATRNQRMYLNKFLRTRVMNQIKIQQ